MMACAVHDSRGAPALLRPEALLRRTEALNAVVMHFLSSPAHLKSFLHTVLSDALVHLVLPAVRVPDDGPPKDDHTIFVLAAVLLQQPVYVIVQTSHQADMNTCEVHQYLPADLPPPFQWRGRTTATPLVLLKHHSAAFVALLTPLPIDDTPRHCPDETPASGPALPSQIVTNSTQAPMPEPRLREVHIPDTTWPTTIELDVFVARQAAVQGVGYSLKTSKPTKRVFQCGFSEGYMNTRLSSAKSTLACAKEKLEKALDEAKTQHFSARDDPTTATSLIDDTVSARKTYIGHLQGLSAAQEALKMAVEEERTLSIALHAQRAHVRNCETAALQAWSLVHKSISTDCIKLHAADEALHAAMAAVECAESSLRKLEHQKIVAKCPAELHFRCCSNVWSFCAELSNGTHWCPITRSHSLGTRKYAELLAPYGDTLKRRQIEAAIHVQGFSIASSTLSKVVSAVDGVINGRLDQQLQWLRSQFENVPRFDSGAYFDIILGGSGTGTAAHAPQCRGFRAIPGFVQQLSNGLPLVVVDAAHNKSCIRGVWLIAATVAPNGQYCMMGQCFVRGPETKDAFVMFFEGLKRAGLQDSPFISFISDRGKAVQAAIGASFPFAHKYACFVHVLRNAVSNAGLATDDAIYRELLGLGGVCAVPRLRQQLRQICARLNIEGLPQALRRPGEVLVDRPRSRAAVLGPAVLPPSGPPQATHTDRLLEDVKHLADAYSVDQPVVLVKNSTADVITRRVKAIVYMFDAAQLTEPWCPALAFEHAPPLFGVCSSNAVESYNGAIRLARQLPVSRCAGIIRQKTYDKYAKLSKEFAQHAVGAQAAARTVAAVTGCIVPGKFEKAIDAQRALAGGYKAVQDAGCTGVWSVQAHSYQAEAADGVVQDGSGIRHQRCVDMSQGLLACSCKEPQHNGYPCRHIWAVLMYTREGGARYNWKDFVHPALFLSNATKAFNDPMLGRIQTAEWGGGTLDTSFPAEPIDITSEAVGPMARFLSRGEAPRNSKRKR